MIKMAKGSLFIPGKASTVTPPEDITAARFGSTIAVWKDCEEEVVYEFLKFLEENGAAISEKTHAMLTLETLSNFTPGVTREIFHPGAIRFFEEKGVRIPQ